MFGLALPYMLAIGVHPAGPSFFVLALNAILSTKEIAPACSPLIRHLHNEQSGRPQPDA